ncbi:unnamed protein product [Ceutorhynchus assimilis]|uniref:C2H2-type domain-containing protein n=1 Tax=Ceutorhynchus assimilis TaxID=467358 RepID=A0A9P0DCJ2_9CUCU|nr:unnamed protein product [Ceutorhynchus assimilis]
MEYEDDTHFCLKCNITIVGLDNYVFHRKSSCSKSTVEPSKSSLPSQLLPPDAIGSEAADFFSSLELRSSSEKPAVQSTSGKSFSGILTRSKISAAIQATVPQKDAEPSKSGKNVWIGGNQIKDLGTGDNQSKLIKAVAHLERQKHSSNSSQSTPTLGAVYKDSEDYSEDDEYDEDESSEEDCAPPRNYTGGKWRPSSPVHWSNNTNRSGSRDWNEAPPCFTGGEWKHKSLLSSSYTRGKWKPFEDDSHPTIGGKHPPPSHTKGKWKSKMDNEDDRYPPASHTEGKWNPKIDNEDDRYPPESHTKGKWKPKVEDENNMVSPPSHTKEKERFKSCSKPSPRDKLKSVARKPSTSKNPENTPKPSKPTPGKSLKSKQNQDKVRKQLIRNVDNDSPPRNVSIPCWCHTCNRMLASKLVYVRHLKSKLHFKRAEAARQFDSSPILRKTNIEDKSSGLSVEKSCDLPVVEPTHSFQPSTGDKLVKKRKRRNIFEICVVCRSKVNKYLMGKHIVSHYHYRRGDITSEASKNLVLSNILSVVLESPFQCSMCKFYCNTHHHFVDHWKSKFHLDHDKNYPGYYFCELCEQQSPTSEEMHEHLNSPQHFEVISVINGSIPITIKKIDGKSCLSCQKLFTLNIQLLNHCRKTGHDSSNVSICNKEDYKCSKCSMTFFKAISLQRHFKRKHGHDYFFCGICNVEFKSSNEAKLHRMSLKHRYAALAKREPKNLKRNCQYCQKKFDNFLLLKEHLQSDHPDHKIRCPHCGTNFTVSQELSNHLRAKLCRFSEDPIEHQFRCDICPYQSDSTSEMLFHKALHSKPSMIEVFYEEGNQSNAQPVPRYKCPLCEKIYPKHSLKPHLRLHTKERPYMCKSCGATFTRKNNLLYHEKNHERKQVHPKKKSEDTTFLCSACGARFNKKFTLQQHMLIHTGKLCKCPQDGCFYSARKISELKEHLNTHSSEKTFACYVCEYIGKTKKQLKRHMTVHDETKKFSCNRCSFTSRTSAHLKRHMRLHTGAKPFKCPYCEYKCNNMENLRRHVLATTKHSGKCIYECKFCEASQRFQTNVAKEFKAHLILTHEGDFGSSNDAASYISGIYEAENDETNLISLEEDVDDPDSVQEVEPIILKTNGFSKIILKLDTGEDPVVAQLTQSSGNVAMDEVLPMPIKTACTFDLTGQYDVGESGDLVPFQSAREEDLFETHF